MVIYHYLNKNPLLWGFLICLIFIIKPVKMKIKINEEQYNRLINSLKENEPSSGETETNDVNVKTDKDLVQSIVNDPSMMKAFYKQPSLWNSFLSALTGKKRKGTGIMPGEDIAKKYGLYMHSKQMRHMVKDFNFNKPVSFTLISDDIEFPVGENKPPIIYKNSKRYLTMVSEPKLGDKYLVLRDENTKTKIFIKDKNTSEISRNTFNVVFSKLVPDGQGGFVKKNVNAIITLDSKKGSGFYNYKR